MTKSDISFITFHLKNRSRDHTESKILRNPHYGLQHCLDAYFSRVAQLPTNYGTRFRLSDTNVGHDMHSRLCPFNSCCLSRQGSARSYGTLEHGNSAPDGLLMKLILLHIMVNSEIISAGSRAYPSHTFLISKVFGHAHIN